MTKTGKIIFFSALAIIFLFVIFYFIFLFSQNVQENLSLEKDRKIKDEQQKEIVDLYNAQFPDVVNGKIIIFSDDKSVIKTEDKVEYLISPVRPKSFFEDSGVKNGKNVTVRGKIIDSGSIFLGSIKSNANR